MDSIPASHHRPGGGLGRREAPEPRRTSKAIPEPGKDARPRTPRASPGPAPACSTTEQNPGCKRRVPRGESPGTHSFHLPAAGIPPPTHHPVAHSRLPYPAGGCVFGFRARQASRSHGVHSQAIEVGPASVLHSPIICMLRSLRSLPLGYKLLLETVLREETSARAGLELDPPSTGPERLPHCYGNQSLHLLIRSPHLLGSRRWCCAASDPNIVGQNPILGLVAQDSTRKQVIHLMSKRSRHLPPERRRQPTT